MRYSIVAALAFAASAAAAAQSQTQPTQSSQQSTSPRANQSITVTGCVEAGANNTYTLVAAPANSNEPVTGSTATTPAGSKVAKTVTYTLAGSNVGDLKSHVGHTVQVTGVEAAPQVVSKSSDTRTGAANTQSANNGSANAQGTSGSNPQGSSATAGAQGTSGTNVQGTSGSKNGATPTVQTTEQTQIVARQLTVNSVKMVSNNCQLIK